MKSLTSIHQDLANAYTNVIEHPEEMPTWLTEGITYLLPKSEDTEDPKNYRPITCLPTMYKILTSVITERTYRFLHENQILPTEQKGCKRGSYGCKEQLLINKMVIEDCKSRRKNLTTAWIDYKKAFDSVPHTWIIKCLELYKICPVAINFMKECMKNWKTTLHLRHANGSLTSRLLSINRGIFQGDSLSPLLFCLALAPLSSLLNESSYGYEIYGQKVTHLFYMDDLKTYARDDEHQTGLLKIVKTFSDDIQMEFGLDKCAKATFKRGRLTETTNIELDADTCIRDLEQEGIYKYLGVNEGDGIQHATMKEKVRKEYYRRTRLILNSQLNSANKVTAINTLAIPVVAYSFNIVNWKVSELKKLDTKTRKFLTMHKMHHPKSDVDRLYVARKFGGRGLMQLETSYKITTIGLSTFLKSSDDPLLGLVQKHDAKKKIYSAQKEAQKFFREFDLSDLPREADEFATHHAKRTKQKARQQAQEHLSKLWEGKALHGKHPKRMKDADVDLHRTNQWLMSSGLKAETEGLIIAAQDQSLATRLYHSNIIKDGTNPLCRMCGKFDESIDHVISGCPELAKTEYIQRHDNAASYIHWKVCQSYDIKTTDKWYDHKPDTVVENEQATILWNMPIHTDREIAANKPDIIIRDHTNQKCQIIDMAVPSDRNTSVKVVEKLSKYKDLEIEIARMWKMGTETIPVVIGALGVIKKGLEKYVDKIPGTVSIDELQKITLLGTARILRRVLSIK